MIIRRPQAISRLFFQLCVSMAAVGILVIFFSSDIGDIFESHIIGRYLKITAGVVAGGGIFGLISLYLNGDLSNLSRSRDLTYDSGQIEELSWEIRDIKKSFEKMLNASSPSQNIDLDSLAISIREQAVSQLPEKVAAELENKYSTKSIDNSQMNKIREDFSTTSLRLGNEIVNLGRRSNTNLLIGILTTAAAAGCLFYIAFETKGEFNGLTHLLSHYIPRITTIIFIEVFALFFLKLYRTTLQEIKYFQNELTNIELKKVAFEAALIQKPDTPMVEIIGQLVKTERNSLGAVENHNEGGKSFSIKDINSLIEAAGKATGKG